MVWGVSLDPSPAVRASHRRCSLLRALAAGVLSCTERGFRSPVMHVKLSPLPYVQRSFRSPVMHVKLSPLPYVQAGTRSGDKARPWGLGRGKPRPQTCRNDRQAEQERSSLTTKPPLPQPCVPMVLCPT